MAPTDDAIDFNDVAAEPADFAPDTKEWRRHQLMQIAKFALPAMSIPLADPLMSLVDNVMVGQFSGTLELAALGPCTLIFSLGYLFNALSVATLSAVAESVQGGNTNRATRALSTAMFVGLAIGCSVFLLLRGNADRLIALTGCAIELRGPAVQYLKVRAFAAPAVLIIMVAQAGLLAQKDSRTPFMVVVVSAIVNVVGDWLLITQYNMGIAGAAWATVASQVTAAVALLWTLHRFSPIKLQMRIPSLDDLRLLGSTLGAMVLVYMCKNLTYVQLQLAAAVLAPVTLAAHQLLYSLWSLASFVTTPLEQAALTFLPAARSHSEAAETGKLMVSLGVGAGVMGGITTTALPLLLPQLLTSDPALHNVMRTVLPQVFLSMVLCGIDVASNGMLVACKDLKFVVRSMVVTFTACTAYFSWCRHANLGLPGIWWGLCFFFFLRAAQSLPRLPMHFSRRQHAARTAAAS